MPWSHCDLITIYMHQLYQLLSPLKFVNSMGPDIISGRGLVEKEMGCWFFCHKQRFMGQICVALRGSWSLKTNASFLNEINLKKKQKNIIYMIVKFLGYLGRIYMKLSISDPEMISFSWFCIYVSSILSTWWKNDISDFWLDMGFSSLTFGIVLVFDFPVLCLLVERWLTWNCLILIIGKKSCSDKYCREFNW